MNGFYDFPYLGNGKSYQLRSCRHIFQRGGFETTNRHGCPGIIERIFNHDTQKKTTMMGSKSPNWTIVFFLFFLYPQSWLLYIFNFETTMETRISDGAWDDHQMHEMWKTHGETRLESDLQVLGFPQLCEGLQEDKLHV